MRWVYGIALLAVLGWGLEQVTVSPLETGDVYPPYSSLRPDPLGGKALYESFAALPGVAVERLYKERSTLEERETMFVLGVDPVSFADLKAKELEEYEKLVARGGRLVIAFVPARAPASHGEQGAMAEQWRVRFRYRRGADENRPAIPRDTALYFEASEPWRPMGVHDAIERDFGRGSIALVADSFPLSNEGLREARDAGFLASLSGPATRVVFDENHFGVVETGSVTTLMRKYHLEGAIAVLALAAGLFLWRSTSSFLPPRKTREAEPVAGRDSIDGLAALLYRGVPEKNLLDTCFAEWSKSTPGERRTGAVEDEIRRKRAVVEGYRAACQALADKERC